MIQKKCQSAYSLMELSVVIMIMATMAVSMAPAVSNLLHQSREISVARVASLLELSASLVHDKALTKQVSNGEILLGTQTVSIEASYPSSNWPAGFANLIDGVSVATGERCSQKMCVKDSLSELPGLGQLEGDAFAIWPNGVPFSSACYAYYWRKSPSSQPQFGFVDSDC